MPLAQVYIELDKGSLGTVTINGVDVSNMFRAVEVYAEATETPVVKFHLQDGARVELNLERAEIVQLDDTAE